MQRPPVVSVIVPAYNAAATLRETLVSALGQTLRNIEVVVVDDGSSDATANIVREFASRDPRLRLLRQPNQGVAAARNHAIRMSRGMFVAPLDADDVWSPRKLEEQVARMTAGGEQMGMVYSWWTGIDAEGRSTGITQTWDMEGATYGVLLFANFIGNSSVPLFRRSALDAVGFYDESFRARQGEGCEDWDLSLRIAERYHIGLAPAFHTAYRDSGTSMSKDCDQMARSFEHVWESAFSRNNGLPERLYRWSKGTFLLYLASQAHDVGQHSDSRKWLVKAAIADPIAAVGRGYWRRLLTSVMQREKTPSSRSGELYRALSLVALAAPDQLEPTLDAWWKVYARVRRRRVRWAAAWSKDHEQLVPGVPQTTRRPSVLLRRTA